MPEIVTRLRFHVWWGVENIFEEVFINRCTGVMSTNPVTTTLVAFDRSEARRAREILRLVPGMTMAALLRAIVTRGLSQIESVEDIEALIPHMTPRVRGWAKASLDARVADADVPG